MTEFTRSWHKLAIACLGVSLGSNAIYYFTQGVFMRPLQAEFGWTRGEVSIGPTVFGLAFTFGSPLCGLAVDKFGFRTVTAFSIMLLSACFWGLSQMQGSLSSFALLAILIATAAAGTTIPYIRLVSGWFTKARGLAIGLTMVGAGVAAAVVPPFAADYIHQHGWRDTYRLFALVALLPLPFVLIFGRERRAGSLSGSDEPLAGGMSISEVVRTRQFWVLGLTFIFAGAAITGLIPHLPPMLQDAGAGPTRVGAVMGVMGLAVIAGRILTGFALDRVFAPYIAATILALSALGCCGLAVFGQGFDVVGAALIGLSMGAETDLLAYMSARYFGMRSFGAVFGLQYGLFGLGAAIGPLVAGLLYNHYGDYDIALFAASFTLIIGIPLLLSIGRYPDDSSQPERSPQVLSDLPAG